MRSHVPVWLLARQLAARRPVARSRGRWPLLTWAILLLLAVNVVGIFLVGREQAKLVQRQHALLLQVRGDLDDAADQLEGLAAELATCRAETGGPNVKMWLRPRPVASR